MSALTSTPTPYFIFSHEYSNGGKAVDTNTQSGRMFFQGYLTPSPTQHPNSNSRTCPTKSFHQKSILVRGHKSGSGRPHAFPSSPTEAVTVASLSPPQPQRNCLNVTSSEKSSLPSSTLLSAPMALSICSQYSIIFFSKYLFIGQPHLPD